MGARPDIFEDLHRVGVLKRDLLNRRPPDNALANHTHVRISRDTVGAWLRGERLPKQMEKLLGVLAQIRAEAARRDLLDAPVDSTVSFTVAELLDPDRWQDSWERENKRRTQANQDAAQRQRAHAALEQQELRARQWALADRPRPVGSWSAQRLGVHAAIPGQSPRERQSGFVLPRYVPRPHDSELRARLSAAASEGARPQMVVVRGASCTGKTRTAYEAVRASVPEDFDLLFPADADGLLAVLAADALELRTVLWLNEAQEYLNGAKGEAVAAALLRRLDGEGPLLVVATLWPDHDQTLTHRPAPGAEDPHVKARELLAQARYIHVPDSFTGHLDAVREAVHDDGSLAAALDTKGVDLTQVLAAGPDLVEHYEHPAGKSGVYGRALISAAMDAHRLGVASPLPLDFLRQAAPGYLTDTERASAAPDWFTGALAYARIRVKDTTPPLQEVPHPSGMGAVPGVVRLTDFLQQHGHRTRTLLCPPAAFWEAAPAHLTDPTDLSGLGRAADKGLQYRHRAHLYCAAAEAGYTYALVELAEMREEAGDQAGAERLLRQALDAGYSLALVELARIREKAGDREEAEQLALRAIDAGYTYVPTMLAEMRGEAGDREGAERLFRQAFGAGDADALVELPRMREKAGEHEEAEQLALQAVDAGKASALVELARIREEAGDQAGAERLLRQALDAGYSLALVELARMREKAGNHEEAERFTLRAVAAGSAYALVHLARMREKAGDRESAERLVLQAVDAGEVSALMELARMREEAGDRKGAEWFTRRAVNAGYTYAPTHLARMREKAGDRESAERLLRQAVDADWLLALVELARMREEDGDHEEAERFALQAIDAGYTNALTVLARARKEPSETYQRYGLDAYRTLAEPWEWPEPRAL